MLNKHSYRHLLLILTLLGVVIPIAATAQVATTTTVTSAPNPSAQGDTLTLTATVTAAVPGVAPVGTVRFTVDGNTGVGNPINPATNPNPATLTGQDNAAGTATASFQLASPTPGPHTITATYSGGNVITPATTFSGSNGSVNQIVKATTTVNPFTASPVSSSSFGQTVTFSATVAGDFGTPTGTIQFDTNGTPSGPPVNLDSTGKATYTTSSLPKGSYVITAVYSGDGFNAGATGTLSGGYTVNAAGTAVSTPTAAPSGPKVGQAVTLSSTVSVTAPGAGTPTGTITFSDGASFSQSGLIASDGTASVTTSGLTAGLHNITATYNNTDGNFTTNTSSTPLALAVGADATATGVTSSGNPSAFGQSVTFTIDVTNATGTGTTPTGSVTLTYPNAGGTDTTTSAAALNGNGRAQISISDLAVGTDSVTANYTPADGYFAASSGSTTQAVNNATTVTTLASSSNPAPVNQSVTFTANVATQSPGGGVPTGTVTFTITQGVTTVHTSAAIPLSGSGNSATANDSFTLAAVGNYVVTAVYAPGTGFTGSSGRLAPDQQVVPSTSTTVNVTSSNTPSIYGQAVTFTAKIQNFTGTPTGSVQFFADGTQIGTAQPVALGAGGYTASITYPTQGTDPLLASGPHTISASYFGDPDNGNGSGSLVQTVDPAATTTSAAAAPSPSTFGQSVTITATVVNAGDGMGGGGTGQTPTGTVTFSEGTTTLGSGSLKAAPGDTTGNTAVGVFSTAGLAAGQHDITATFVPADANFKASDNTAAPEMLSVNPAQTTTAVSSTPNPSNLNQSVTFTATVTNIGDGTTATGVTPTGTVTFVDVTDPTNVTTLGTASLSAGADGNSAVTTFAATFATSGQHTITATYNPSGGNFVTSAGNVTQSVNRASPAVTLSSNSPQNTSIYGQPVTFTAIVPGNGGVTPTGTVTFSDSVGGKLGTVQLSGGQAIITTSILLAGPHTITATYNGDNNFAPSATDPGHPFVQTVIPAATAATISANPSPSNVGDVVTFSVIATNTSGTGIAPTGQVTLTDTFGVTPGSPGKQIGSIGSLAALSTDKSGNSALARITVSTLAQGIHTITATYSPANNPNSQTGNFGGSTTILSQTVYNGAATLQSLDQAYLLVPGTVKYTNDGLTTAQLLKLTDSQTLGINVTNIVSPSVYFNGNPLSGVTVDSSTHLTVQIPASLTANAGFATVQIVNADANPTANTQNTLTIPINPAMALPTYPVSSTRTIRMFSLPYDYTGVSPYDVVQAPALSVLGSTVSVSPILGAGGFQYDPVNELLTGLTHFTQSAADLSYLALYHWDPNQLRYLTTAPATGQADSVPFVLGQAFWGVGGTDAQFLGVTSIGTPAGFNPTGIPLQKGWNMVGDPFPTPIDLASMVISYQGVALPLYSTANTPDSAVSQGIVGPIFWSYEQAKDGTTGYQLNYSGLSGHSAMKPYEGYWFYSYQACTLLVNNTPPSQ